MGLDPLVAPLLTRLSARLIPPSLYYSHFPSKGVRQRQATTVISLGSAGQTTSRLRADTMGATHAMTFFDATSPTWNLNLARGTALW